MRRILATLIVAACVFATRAQSQPQETTAQAADTVSAALATVWAGHIAPVLDARYPGDAKAAGEFVRGITDAFNVSPEQEAYYQGILQGFTVVERLGQMRDLGFPIDRDAFIKALSTALAGGETGFTPTSADHYLNDYMSRQYEAQMAADTLSVESQNAFLAREEARDGVIKTPSGLLFEVITEGEGDGPTLDDSVVVDYTGKLYNGEVFDSSDGQPVTFPVKGLVPGFTQGLLMMKPGGTYRIIIPASLGYGSKGASGVIPGNAALDFTIKLDHVVKN